MSKLPQLDPVDPTPPPPPLPTTPPPPPAKPPSKVRAYVSVGVLVAILAVVLYAVKDNQQANDLAVGTCFDRPAAGADISTVAKKACTEAHDAEVFYVAADLPDGTYSDATLSSYVDATCKPHFATYVGYAIEDSTDLDYGAYYPGPSQWSSGSRSYVCWAYRQDKGKLTQSVKKA